MKEKSEEMNSIDAQKDAVTKALLDQNHKFIVVIDDIDRLNNSQIRAIFQLINTVAGFPNMIYLLSFDRELLPELYRRNKIVMERNILKR